METKLLKKIIKEELLKTLKEEQEYIADFAEDPKSEKLMIKNVQILLNGVLKRFGIKMIIKTDGILGTETMMALKSLSSSGKNDELSKELPKYIPLLQQRKNMPDTLEKINMLLDKYQ